MVPHDAAVAAADHAYAERQRREAARAGWSGMALMRQQQDQLAAAALQQQGRQRDEQRQRARRARLRRERERVASMCGDGSAAAAARAAARDDFGMDPMKPWGMGTSDDEDVDEFDLMLGDCFGRGFALHGYHLLRREQAAAATAAAAAAAGPPAAIRVIQPAAAAEAAPVLAAPVAVHVDGNGHAPEVQGPAAAPAPPPLPPAAAAHAAAALAVAAANAAAAAPAPAPAAPVQVEALRLVQLNRAPVKAGSMLVTRVRLLGLQGPSGLQQRLQQLLACSPAIAVQELELGFGGAGLAVQGGGRCVQLLLRQMLLLRGLRLAGLQGCESAADAPHLWAALAQLRGAPAAGTRPYHHVLSEMGVCVLFG
ncbi:hypothetical protein COO60DRAFT_629557 [Scenedesmus sp. NREL 46B-D3]|nr:hypothetical protein COO60DRAFT_629557 [Scenedesmus sp. NREL 46B-D3]